MKISKVWEILESFKASCKSHGWRISKNEDWIEIDDKYHNFLSAREIPLSSFKRIVSNGKCIIREGLSYSVVRASYSAWLFSETPPEILTKTICENPDFSTRIALYDLSPMLEGRNFCTKLNQTDSPVFQEFESFLQDELKIKLESLAPFSVSADKADSFTLAEVA